LTWETGKGRGFRGGTDKKEWEREEGKRGRTRGGKGSVCRATMLAAAVKLKWNNFTLIQTLFARNTIIL